MNLLELNVIEVNPKQQAKASIIWLHGLGASANDFLPIVPQLNLPHDHGIRFLFPNAPMQKVTINNGYTMPAWYDIYGLTEDIGQDEAGIRNTERLVAKLIDKELQRGIKSEHIILAGFSQGGAMALHTSLRYPKPLGGIIALSTYLPLADKVAAEGHTANKATPILMMHGLHDPVVKLEWGELSRQILTQLGYSIDWQTYAMPHSICPEQIRYLVEWLLEITYLQLKPEAIV